VVAADERNSPEIRTEAKANVARDAMTMAMGPRARKADFLASWGEDSINGAELQWITKSLSAYGDLKKNGPAVLQAEASYYEALILYLYGSHTASNEEIFWLIDNLPGQGEWRFKALLILAHNYAALDDVFQANYTLDFIIAENFIAETVEQAKVFQAILNSPAEDAAGPDEETISEMPTLP